jgi:broad specificity phosphatase PhoE
MTLKLYFLRHGETIYSQTGGYCGRLDPELTAAGLEMAEQLATAYKSTPWQAVFVSPMQRTIATIKPLCTAVGLDMQLRDGLMEINYGEWEGKSNADIKQNYADDYVQWLTEPAWNPPTGGETAVEISSRSALVIAEIQRNYTDGNVLIVSHKATIRIILCNLMGIDLGRYRDRIDMPAASISIVEFREHGPMLKVLGDRAYMSNTLSSRAGT